MPEVKSVIKLDLFPDKDAIAILDGQSRICNWLYNHLLEVSFEMRKAYCQTQSPEISKMLYSKRGLRNQVPALKVKHPFLKQVHSSPLKNTALRLSESIQAYQKSRKGKRKGKQTGWPRFRSWKAKWFSLFYDEPNKGFKILPQGLQISLGKSQEGKSRSVYIPMPDARLLKDKHILNFRLVKQAGLFKAVFTVTRKLVVEKTLSRVIVLDPNHKNLAYGVDLSGIGTEIESPWWLKHYDKQLDKITAKRDRCQRQSN